LKAVLRGGFRFRRRTMVAKNTAMENCRFILDAIEDATGERPKVNAYSYGRIKYLDVRKDDGTVLYLHFRAESWPEMCRQLKAARDVYLELSDLDSMAGKPVSDVS
jgi:hypothetical protein